MDPKIYVIGHRNPDTDSVVSAAAYAELKRSQGMNNCYAARAGNLNPQTEYIFERFKAPVPEYLPDLTPKAAYYIREKSLTVNADTPLWNALDIMEKENLRVLPIVDALGVYQSMLHYRRFAEYVIGRINPHSKAVFPVSIDHLRETLRAQPLSLYHETEVHDSSIVIAASYNHYFIEHLPPPESTLVIMGDRFDLQRFCITKKVRALILTSGNTLDRELIELAEKNEVSVLSSPYDTASTAMLIMYSANVGSIGDTSVPLFNLNDPVRLLKEPLATAPSRGLPIGDDEGRVEGLLFSADLLNEPQIQIIMVDHNEPSQAIEGIENYHILEVIDHHRLGNLSTRYPITFINQPVGATSTIITGLYREQRIPMRRDIASILLCGILSDTLAFKSATTTGLDRQAAEYLAEVTGLDIDVLATDLREAGSRINTLSAQQLITMDMKEYTEESANGGIRYSVSQIETSSPESILARKDEIITALGESSSERGMLFSALLATDVTVLDSFLFISGDAHFIGNLSFPRLEENVFILKGVVSRKKQLIPLLSEMREKVA